MTARKKTPIPDAEGADLIADQIEKVADAAQALLGSRLTEKALVLLVAHESRVPQATVRQVLQAAADLRKFVR